MIRINVTSVLVDDQDKALDFYTEKLGFEKKTEIPAGDERLSAAGVRFTQEPLEMGDITTTVLDDTCGNLIQLASSR